VDDAAFVSIRQQRRVPLQGEIPHPADIPPMFAAAALCRYLQLHSICAQYVNVHFIHRELSSPASLTSSGDVTAPGASALAIQQQVAPRHDMSFHFKHCHLHAKLSPSCRIFPLFSTLLLLTHSQPDHAVWRNVRGWSWIFHKVTCDACFVMCDV
jgi:hypothetical protein